MANLSVAARCNRDCSYCFAMETLDAVAPDQTYMPLETFERSLDFLERSGIGEARLLGGEPTIHPRFGEMLDLALERGLRVLVFSGGLIPERALRRLERGPPGAVSVLVNVLAPGQGRASEQHRQREVYRRLGSRVVLGLNVTAPSVELGFLLELIAEYGLAPRVRLGLAHPILDGSNDYLHPRHYPEVGRRVTELAFRALARGVEIDFDCGWVPCMFPEGTLEALGKGPEEVGLRCSPILDVLPDGKAISCYPLARHATEDLPDDTGAARLRDRFAARQQADRRLMLYPACTSCGWRLRGACTGGCLAGSLRRLRSHPFAFPMPEEEGVGAPPRRRVALPVLEPGGDTEPARGPAEPVGVEGSSRSATEGCGGGRTWVVPYVDQPLSFWEELHDTFGPVVREIYFPLPGGSIGSGRPPQPDVHLPAFLRHAPLPKGVLINALTLPLPVDEIAPAVIEELRRLMGEYGIAGATVSQPLLAERVREALPDLKLTASVLMEIAEPIQVRAIEGLCETLVPASRIVRDLPALQALRAAFRGRIRLLVNEACLPGCPYRVQHFHEMASGFSRPKALCAELLAEKPWMRLVGSWVAPQYLHHYDGLYDELKLAGRVTLSDPAQYRRVLGAYVRRQLLLPSEIGGGPSSVLKPIAMSDELFEHTLTCGRRCHECNRCPEYYEAALASSRRGAAVAP